MDLFTGIKIRNCEIKNRIVMPPMVAFGKTKSDGVVTDQNVAHYKLRAENNVGLIITEALCVSREGRLDEDQIGIWSEDCIDGLKRIADVCHQHGAKVFAQLHHAGMMTRVSERRGPSDYEICKKDGTVIAKASGYSKAEIHLIRQQFIDAAVRAEKAGFDGIELHGAHEYLLCQFFSPVANHREDEYGGSMEGRMRLALEIIEGIRAATREDFVLGCRIGSCEPSFEEGREIAKRLEAAGVDYLNVSTGFSTSKRPDVPEDFPYNWIVYGGVMIRREVRVPVFVVNQIKTVAQAKYLIEHNDADMVCIARGMLADPAWAKKAATGEPIVECAGCKPCGWFKKTGTCVRNPEKR